MGHFFKSKPSTCTCFLPSPPLSALPQSAESRFRRTVVLPRGITTSHPGDTTTPSLLTSRSTIRANTNNNAIIHPFYHTHVESMPANKKTRIVVYMVLL